MSGSTPRLALGTLLIAAIVLAAVWALGRSRDGAAIAPRETAPSSDQVAGISGSGGDPDMGVGPGHASPEVAVDLAMRLARAADGGMRARATGADPASATAPATGSASAPGLPPRPPVRLDHPLTASEQLEYVAALHDYIVLRRDDLRAQLAALDASGQGDSAAATRVRSELTRLTDTEPTAARQVEELAARAARERSEAPAAP